LFVGVEWSWAWKEGDNKAGESLVCFAETGARVWRRLRSSGRVLCGGARCAEARKAGDFFEKHVFLLLAREFE